MSPELTNSDWKMLGRMEEKIDQIHTAMFEGPTSINAQLSTHTQLLAEHGEKLKTHNGKIADLQRNFGAAPLKKSVLNPELSRSKKAGIIGCLMAVVLILARVIAEVIPRIH